RGETAGRRAERLCDEEGVSLTTTGDLDESIRMGPQGIGRTLVDELNDCANTEAAGALLPVLTEQRTARGLHFRTRASFYNSSPTLTLDYSSGHVWEPFEVVPDDLQLANDVTA